MDVCMRELWLHKFYSKIMVLLFSIYVVAMCADFGCTMCCNELNIVCDVEYFTRSICKIMILFKEYDESLLA